jgi:hypothetical protein
VQSVVVHAHLYQPPREDPWLELVEREHSAHPFHDWNTKIERECYRAMVAARLPNPDGRIRRIVNLLEWASFDVGATLLGWLERETPRTYQAILQADVRSRERLGHGNALALPYHHVILPLASRRDKVTEVRWGLRDFRHRFGREAVGMWLPETAVDRETLDVLAVEGVRFTILAPHQVSEVPLHGLPASVRTGGNRRLAVFVYDGALSHDVAFGPLVRDAGVWADRMVLPPDDVRGPKLVAMATDGETYGHHHRFGEMALAAMLERLAAMPVRVENFASFLAANPPRQTVTLREPSSWSCPHGVGRWRADCGCRTEAATSQAWRDPLRTSLDWLAARLDARFEEAAATFGGEPWAARDAWDPDLLRDTEVGGGTLLEMQRHRLRMFTSCGWFFDDIAGIESQIVLRHAVRAIELAGPSAASLLEGLAERLAAARSNHPDAGTGADILRRRVVPHYSAEQRGAAGLGAAAALAPTAVLTRLGIFTGVPSAPGVIHLRHGRTGRANEARVAVREANIRHLEVEVRVGGEDPVVLHLADLPEPAREAVRHAGQSALIARALNAGETDAVARGTTMFPEALETAMHRALADVDLAGLEAGLDLLALDNRPVPFDVQTHFVRAMAHAPPDTRDHLLALASRFGFASDFRADHP